MDQRSFQTLLHRTVALPVVLLGLLAVVLAGEILLLSDSLRWLDHSDQVISTARQLQRQIVEMETGLRGYRLTKDRTFLDAYHEAKSKLPEQSDALQRLVADNPSQTQRLQDLQHLYARWTAWSEQQMQALRTAGPSAEDLLIGQQLMEEIRRNQREFVAQEETLRRERSGKAKILNAATIGSAVGLSLLIAILLFSITRRALLELSASYERHLRAEVTQQEELKQSREWFQITLKSLGEAVVATDEAGVITFINPVAQHLTGWEYPAAKGKRFHEVVRLCDERTRLEVEDPVETVRRAQQVVSYSSGLILTNGNGKEYPIELTGAPILGASQVLGVVVVFRDITQRRQTEQTLRTSERLSLAGRLSATIAHEVRNPLDTVTNLVYLLQHDQKSNPVAMQYLDMASEELARIAQITSQLLTFHRESRNPVPVNLTEVLESVLVLFSPQIKQNHVVVSKRFETDLSVRGFPGELRQVFSNLVGNALEAIPSGGHLLLHTRESTLASDPACRGIRVTVLDNGSGIPRGVRKNLFAPFYTTKGEKGTGLGLWISRGILEKHEGTIHVASTNRNGRSGTAFSVFLPFEQKSGRLEAIAAPPEM